ncbi:MAG TPA: DUF29 domain-containing protein [Acetobacteraceae bacterium]|nr:DUF29 domain-containing protein [Acetobacteraceae bacterium]
MENDLYWQDILVWSERQADLLRHAAQETAVNGVDWDRVIEEIEDVGRSELHSVEILMMHAMVHLLKVAAWPTAQPREHWRSEITGFLVIVKRRFAPSMRRRISLDQVYEDALKQLRDTTIDGQPPSALPERCPFTLDAFLAVDRDLLEAQLTEALQEQLDTDRHLV